MWIVSLALRRPYTFVVMALLILILTPIVILRTSIDIFPDINIPVISIVWQYTGMQPQEMADRFLSNTERGLTTLVNDIQHIESVALQDRKSTRLNSSHMSISYAVFCLKKKNITFLFISETTSMLFESDFLVS